VEYGPVTPTAVGVYRGLFSGPNTTSWRLLTSGIGGSLPTLEPWPLQGFVLNSGASYCGQRYKAKGLSEERSYVFLSGAEKLYISAATGTSTLVGTWNFEIHRWNSEGAASLIRILQAPSVGGLPNIWPAGLSVLVDAAVEGTGYYSVEFTGVTASAGASTTAVDISMDVGITALTPMIHHRYLNDLAVDAAIGQDARRTACSLLMTNTSAFNIRQWNVVAARLENFSLGTIGYQSVNPLENAAEKYQGDAANGVYTYMEFSSFAENFEDAIAESGCPQFKLDVPDFSNVITITGTAGQQNSFLLAVDTVLEFKSNSQRYPLSVSMLDANMLIEARRISNGTPWFFENPAHISDIVRYISKAWQATRRNADHIGNVAATAFPQYALPIKAVARALRR